MLSRITTASLIGLDAELVTVETDQTQGLPTISLVGLPGATIRESRERIRSALTNSGYSFPMRRITVNLSPANTKKEGSHFDLPIALGVYMSTLKEKKVSPDSQLSFVDYAFLGELSLDGGLNRIAGALPLTLGLREAGIKKIVVPSQNSSEVSLIKGIEVFGAHSLSQVIEHLHGSTLLEANPSAEGRIFNLVDSAREAQRLDYSDVVGQESAKRAMEISAAASHGVAMIGPPGVGKSMVAKRLGTIMPPLDYEDMIDTTKVYSVIGALSEDEPIVTQRPFRAPHHTITSPAMVGGGGNPKPGEISLAHNGVLFLDELPEFKRSVLDVMRQPLEDGEVTISRNDRTAIYPCRFTIVVAMNPCPCGYYGDQSRECTCTETARRRYLGRISGPLLDRIDVHITLSRLPYNDLEFSSDKSWRSSATIRSGVIQARELQKERYRREAIDLNSELDHSLIKKYCPLDRNAKDIYKEAYEKFSLSARSGLKLIKLARTIADLGGSDAIAVNHMAEAISYRTPWEFQ